MTDSSSSSAAARDEALGPRALRSVAWLTDIHLSELLYRQMELFLDQLADCPADAFLISGDISEAPRLAEHLKRLMLAVKRPVYFVLGNHDYYFGSLASTRRSAIMLCEEDPRLVWLSDSDPIELTPTVGLVGHDGWADARLGDYERSLVRMHDHTLIEDFRHLNKRQRLGLLRELGDEAAAHFRRVLPAALQRYEEVLVLTHVPPFKEACWYQGNISDDQWLPHFTCQAVGEVLLEMMSEFPRRKMTVLCGHTHSPGETEPLPNLRVITAGAEYGKPRITEMLQFS